MKLSRTILKLSIFFFAVFSGNSYSQFFDLVLEDMSITTYTEPYVAENSITASNFLVTENGDATFEAGKVITLLPGFSVEEGGLFHAFISKNINSINGNPGSEGQATRNFPNPFKVKTTVSFLASSNGRAIITIYNTVGQVVETIFDRKVSKGSNYEAVFNAGKLSDGIYFYKLATKDLTIVKKMVLSSQ